MSQGNDLQQVLTAVERLGGRIDRVEALIASLVEGPEKNAWPEGRPKLQINYKRDSVRLAVRVVICDENENAIHSTDEIKLTPQVCRLLRFLLEVVWGRLGPKYQIAIDEFPIHPAVRTGRLEAKAGVLIWPAWKADEAPELMRLPCCHLRRAEAVGLPPAMRRKPVWTFGRKDEDQAPSGRSLEDFFGKPLLGPFAGDLCDVWFSETDLQRKPAECNAYRVWQLITEAYEAGKAGKRESAIRAAQTAVILDPDHLVPNVILAYYGVLGHQCRANPVGGGIPFSLPTTPGEYCKQSGRLLTRLISEEDVFGLKIPEETSFFPYIKLACGDLRFRYRLMEFVWQQQGWTWPCAGQNTEPEP